MECKYKIKGNRIPQIEISENDYPSKEKIWDRLYQCRDFELSSFWQKSVFLFGFLSLCFAGYGALVAQVVDNDTNPDSISYIYQYMCGVSMLGIILSVVWIYMMKGSKAWYEVYEKAIYEIECEIFKSGNSKYIEGVWANKMRGDFGVGFFGVKGGSFSPSKINIIIGWVMLGIWIIVSGISCYNLFYNYFSLEAIANHINERLDDIKKVVFFINLVILVCSLFVCLVRHFITSTSIEGNTQRIKLRYLIYTSIISVILVSFCLYNDFWICIVPLIPIVVYWSFFLKSKMEIS